MTVSTGTLLTVRPHKCNSNGHLGIHHTVHAVQGDIALVINLNDPLIQVTVLLNGVIIKSMYTNYDKVI